MKRDMSLTNGGRATGTFIFSSGGLRGRRSIAAMRFKSMLRAALPAIALSACLSTAYGQSIWTGAGADNNWSTDANWQGNTAPIPGTTTDLTFAGTVNLNPDNDFTAGSNFRHIDFASDADPFTLSGNGITWAFSTVAGTITNDSSNLQTIDFNLHLPGNRFATTNGGGGDLLFGGNLTTGSGGVGIFKSGEGTLTVAGDYTKTYGSGLTTFGSDTGHFLLSGNVDGGGNSVNLAGTGTGEVSGTISNTFAVRMNGSGTWTLSGNNTYTSVTEVNSGTLSISNDNNLGAVPGSYVTDHLTIDGGTLRATGGGLTIAANRGISIGSSGATLDNTAMANTSTANFASQITGTGTLTLWANGNTSDTGGGQGGNLTLGSTANDFTGDVVIKSGVVSFAGDGSFGNAANRIVIEGGGLVATGTRTLPATREIVLSGGGDKIFRVYGGQTLTVNGAISGTGNVRHTDGGTLQLNGDNSFDGNLIAAGGSGRVVALGGTNTYTGYTHIRNGATLRLDADDALPNGTAVVLWGGTNFNVNGKTATLGTLTTGSSGDTNVTVNLGNGADLTITNNNLPSGLTSGYSHANMHGRITGSGNITYAHATSAQALWDWHNTSNDFTGDITITRGRLRTALGTDGAGVLGNAQNNIIFNGDVVAALGNNQGTASLQAASSGALTLAATRSIILNDGKEGTFYVWGGNTYTVHGQITGGGNLRKEDGGTLLLTNPGNDYTGLTRIATGTLRLGASGVIPDVSVVEMAGGVFDLNGFDEGIRGLMGTGGNVRNDGASPATLTVGLNSQAADSYSFSGTLTNGASALALIKTGDGTLTLTGNNPYGGGTTITAGTVALGHNNALGSGTVTLAGGTLRPSGPRTLANDVVAEAGTESRLLDNIGTGDLILTGNLSGSGTLTVDSTLSRSLWFQGDNSGFAGTLNFTNNHNGTNLRLGGTETSQNDSDNGADFSGAAFVLSGNTTNNRGMSWNGAADTAVSIGSLSGTGRIGHTARAANWHIGALNTDTTFSGIIEGTNTALTKVGTGTLTLRGKNTHTGGTTVRGGTLVLQSPMTNWNVGVIGGTATIHNGATLQIDTGYNTGSSDTISILGGGTLHYSAPYTAGGGNTTYLGTINLDSSNGQPAVVTGVGAVRMGHNANGLISSTGLAANTFAAGLQLVSGGGYTVRIDTAAGNTLNFSGLISDYTGLTGTPLLKAGEGTLIVSGANTYNGTTTINGGTLLVNNTAGSGTGSGAVTVNSGGTLGGTGSIAGTVTVNAGGTHAPGASVGSQTVGGETWMPGGAFQFEINDAWGEPGGNGDGLGWDLLTVNGTLDLTGLSEQDPFLIDIVSLSDTAPGPMANFVATQPAVWPFLEYGSLAGEFSPDLFELRTGGFENPIGRGHFEILQLDSNWLAIGYVPEPGTWLLLLSAAACGLLVRRRKPGAVSRGG